MDFCFSDPWMPLATTYLYILYIFAQEQPGDQLAASLELKSNFTSESRDFVNVANLQ